MIQMLSNSIKFFRRLDLFLEASYLILLMRWRIGQTRTVRVDHMVHEDTVEQKIYALNQESVTSLDRRWNIHRISRLFNE